MVAFSMAFFFVRSIFYTFMNDTADYVVPIVFSVILKNIATKLFVDLVALAICYFCFIALDRKYVDASVVG